MNDQINALKDDLSFMRELAEAGRRGPLGGGVFLVASGAIYAGACLVQWAGLQRLGGLDPHYTNWSMLDATGLWVVVWLVLARMVSGQRRSAATANQTFAVGWSAIGMAMLVNVGAAAIITGKAHDMAVFQIFPSLALSLYGAAWLIAAAAARKVWMLITALAAFGLALLVAPGLYMMRRAPAAQA